jgi:GT2 family glycosyltransferase
MIFVLIPVFNRLDQTKRVIHALRQQTCYEHLCIVIINDGSTDGTADYLASQLDVVEIKGSGNLWWGGSIQRGLEYICVCSSPGDYVLFLNNDTQFDKNYVETLVSVSREAGGAAVGSVIHESNSNPPLVSIGPRLNLNRIAVWDLLAELSPEQFLNPAPTYQVDALSGRGTLYPANLFHRFGRMRPFWLPHYFSDYEIAMRFGRAGVPLLVSTKAIIYSSPIYGNDISHLGWWERAFSTRSSSNIIHMTFFYMLVGSPFQRITAPLRMLVFATWRACQNYLISKAKKS